MTRQRRTRRAGLLAATMAGVLATAGPAWGWHGKGHRKATRLAMASLPREVPAFFRKGAGQVIHGSEDPDLFRQPVIGEPVNSAERPDHYFDLEFLKGAELPPTSYEALAWCEKNHIQPAKLGFVPYSVAEWTQRLTVAFAEHRAWPKNPYIQQKALVYAGLLAHYAQDLCQPLHTTIHYDGRMEKDGSSPDSGIHLKMDAVLAKLPDAALPGIDPNTVTPLPKLFEGVVAELKASNRLVDRIYALEKQLPEAPEPVPAKGPVLALVQERMAAAARFTARLYVTAWRNSAGAELPPWHEREGKGTE